MPDKSTLSAVCILSALILVACGDPAPFEAPLATDPGDPEGDPDEEAARPVAMAFDIAEDMTRFAFGEAPVDEVGLEHGDSFVTQGYIYPYGFLAGREGTDVNGAPAHPEHVIGEWTCRGHVVGDGVAKETGAWALSTHIYVFYENPGYVEGNQTSAHTVVSEGHELAEEDRAISRSITGATGLAQDARGELLQTFVGTNESGGANLRLFLPVGFEPIIAAKDLPPLPPRDFQPCNWDLFGDERCSLL